MKIIMGDEFQKLCETQISRALHKETELNLTSIDVDNFDFENYDNSYLVYCNSSLLNRSKKSILEINFYEKLSKLKNPFKLILHNSDDEFGIDQLRFLEIPNCKYIYSQNMNVRHPRVKPIPIGFPNIIWYSGSVLNDVIDIRNDISDMSYQNSKKEKLVFCNFTIGEGIRSKRRNTLYNTAKKLNIEFTENLDVKLFFDKLKKHKYCLSPEGNGFDCYRTWESLYVKTIPICKRSVMIEEFAKIFPIYIVDDWEELDLSDLEDKYDTFNWKNYNLLDFDNYCKHIGLL